jgi:hypothetical protein
LYRQQAVGGQTALAMHSDGMQAARNLANASSATLSILANKAVIAGVAPAPPVKSTRWGRPSAWMCPVRVPRRAPSQMCPDVYNNQTTPGTKVEIRSGNGGANQQ